ncbi:MAG: hypothetical protein ACOH12_16175 [Parvibaculaceae bacterium]
MLDSSVEKIFHMRCVTLVLLTLLVMPLHAFAGTPPSIPVPEGYVLQILDPTGGEIARPKDWHYANEGTQSGYMWTMTPEDPKGFYETGLRIQLLAGVQKGTGESRTVFAKNLIDGLKSKAISVVKDCPTSDQGDFMRQCLEVIETDKGPKGDVKYRVLYSVMWGKDLDMIVVTIFGTVPEKWEAMRPVADTMATFKIASKEFFDDAK